MTTTHTKVTYPPWLMMGITVTVCVCLIFGLYMILGALTNAEDSKAQIDSLEKQVIILQTDMQDVQNKKANGATVQKLSRRIGELEDDRD